MIFLYVVIYFVGLFSFLYWDAAFGFGFEWDGGVVPPLGLAAIMWPIVLPCTIVIGGLFLFAMRVASSLDSIKERRLEREERKRRESIL